MLKNLTTLSLVAIFSVGLTGCNRPICGQELAGIAVGAIGGAALGGVLSNSATGAAIGAVAGGALGSAIGRQNECCD